VLGFVESSERLSPLSLDGNGLLGKEKISICGLVVKRSQGF
jgi:hypothetical protein